MSFEELNIPMTFSAVIGSMLAAGVIAAVCIFLLFSTIMLFFYTIALMMGAKAVNIEDRTFGKALTATALNLFLGWIIVGVCLFIFPPLAIVAYFLLPCIFIKWIYECSLGKAIVTAVLSYFAAFLLLFVLMVGAIIISIKFAPNTSENTKDEKIAKIVSKPLPETSAPIEIQKSTKVQEVQTTFVPIKTENKPIQKQNMVVIKEMPPKKELVKKSLPEKANVKTPAKVSAKTSIKVSSSSKQKKSNVKVAAKPKAKTKSSEKKPLPSKRLKNT